MKNITQALPRTAVFFASLLLMGSVAATPVHAQIPLLDQLPGRNVLQQVIGSLFSSRPDVVPQPADERPQVLYAADVVINTPVAGDLIVAGGRVSVDAPVAGDLIVAGGLVQINSTVRGDVIGTAGLLNVAAPLENDLRVAAIGVNLDSTIAKNATIATAFLRQAQRSAINGSLMAYTYRSWLNGAIGGNLDLSGSDVALDAGVGGTANLRSNNLTISRNAEVLEDINASLLNPPTVDPNASLRGAVDLTVRQQATQSSALDATVSAEPVVTPENNQQSFWPLVGRVHAQEGTPRAVGSRVRQLFSRQAQQEQQAEAFADNSRSFFGGILITLVGGSLMLWLFPRFQQGQVRMIREKTAATAATGILWLLLGIIVSVLLMITIIGIPIGIILLLIWIVNLIMAPWVVSQAIGSSLASRMANRDSILSSPYFQLLIGAITLTILTMLPFVGWLVWLVTWTLGMGATLHWILSSKEPETVVGTTVVEEVTVVQPVVVPAATVKPTAKTTPAATTKRTTSTRTTASTKKPGRKKKA